MLRIFLGYITFGPGRNELLWIPAAKHYLANEPWREQTHPQPSAEQMATRKQTAAIERSFSAQDDFSPSARHTRRAVETE